MYPQPNDWWPSNMRRWHRVTHSERANGEQGQRLGRQSDKTGAPKMLALSISWKHKGSLPVLGRAKPWLPLAPRLPASSPERIYLSNSKPMVCTPQTQSPRNVPHFDSPIDQTLLEATWEITPRICLPDAGLEEKALNHVERRPEHYRGCPCQKIPQINYDHGKGKKGDLDSPSSPPLHASWV